MNDLRSTRRMMFLRGWFAQFISMSVEYVYIINKKYLENGWDWKHLAKDVL